MEILLVEDNESIIEGLTYAFNQNNYKIEAKTTIRKAQSYLEENTPKLIILDIQLPDGDGLEFYEKNIKKTNIPVIFLTALDDEDNIVEALNLGAEDYVTKPFSTKELIARINRIIKRNETKIVINVKDISFDIEKMIVKRQDNIITLSSLELQILHLLFINIGKVVKRNTILDKIWEWTGNDVDDHTITVYLKRIREKIKTDIIVTIKGIGYRIDEE